MGVVPTSSRSIRTASFAVCESTPPTYSTFIFVHCRPLPSMNSATESLSTVTSTPCLPFKCEVPCQSPLTLKDGTTSNWPVVPPSPQPSKHMKTKTKTPTLKTKCSRWWKMNAIWDVGQCLKCMDLEVNERRQSLGVEL